MYLLTKIYWRTDQKTTITLIKIYNFIEYWFRIFCQIFSDNFHESVLPEKHILKRVLFLFKTHLHPNPTGNFEPRISSGLCEAKVKVCIWAKWLISSSPVLISGFCSMKRLGVFLLPLDGMLATPSIKFASTHLYTWVLAKEHNVLGQGLNPEHLTWCRVHCKGE